MNGQVTEHVYAVDAGALNLFLIVLPEGLTLIDAGFEGSMAAIEEAVYALGRRADQIRDILGTHSHPDHSCGLAQVKAATGARLWMHPAEAAMVRAGRTFRPWKPAPGLENLQFATQVVMASPQTCSPVEVDREVQPEEIIPVAGGIRALGTPGHALGHLSFLWPGDGGVLFVGDVAKNVEELGLSPIYEDLEQGLESLRSLGQEEFETACFAHGASIVGNAAAVFRAHRWASDEV
jgi:glyoxylase-like metal-dependent hydrolase (beta-lactamase superfamily II)